MFGEIEGVTARRHGVGLGAFFVERRIDRFERHSGGRQHLAPGRAFRREQQPHVAPCSSRSV
jgi:hypothetical protein